MKKIIGLCMIILVFLVHPILASALTTTAVSPSSTKLCNLNPDEEIFTALGIWNNHNETLVNVTAKLIIGSNNNNFLISPTVVSLGNINAFSFPDEDPSWLVQCNGPLEGNYTAYVQYDGAEGLLGTSLEEANATIIVEGGDNTAPQILTHYPSGSVSTPYVTLEISTDEDAFCKYDGNKGVKYEAMSSSFKITGGLNHKTTIQGLQDNYYSYYVRCKDVYGNTASDDYKVSFTVDTPPTAVISLNKDSPLNAGTVEVTLTASEDIEPTPSLYYSFDGDLGTQVPLSGGGKTWKGYIFLENSGGNKIGSFHFSAKDLTGNEGNVIKDGNIFLVDTNPPSPPAMLTAVQQKGHSIKLQWSMPTDDEIDYFKIYRLTEDEPSFNFYDSTNANHFTDTSVAVGGTYYYAVSAVDEAGNEGELSSEVYATLEGITFPGSSQRLTKKEENDSTSILSNFGDKISVAEIDSLLGNIEILLDEMNTIREEFQLEDSAEHSSLSPLEILKENKVSLLKLSEELGSLKENIGGVDTKTIFDGIESDIGDIKGGTLKKISSSEKKTVTLSPQEDITAELLDDFIAGMSAVRSEEEKEAYLARIQRINNNLKIEVAVKELTLEYLDGKEENALFVEKKIKNNEPLEDISILEYVPKDIASSTDEMHFDKDVVVIDKDPLLQYHFNDLNQAKYSFIIDNIGDADINKISETATIVLPKFEESTVQEGNNFLTGFSVSSLSIVTNSWYNIGITAGIIIIVVLASYFFIHLKRDSPENKQVRKKIKFSCLYLGKKLKKLKTIKSNRNYSGKEPLPYLQYAEKEYKKAGLKTLKNIAVLSILKEADEAVNSMDYGAALKLHHLITSHKDLTLIKKNNPKAAKQIKIFQSKMDILLKCQELQYCSKKRDLQNMSSVLNDLANLYNSLFYDISKEDVDFIEQIEKIHQKYSRILLQK